MGEPTVIPKGQLAFDLSPDDALNPADFLMASHNEAASQMVLGFPNWPAPYLGLNLYAPKGAGKSHLGAVFAARFQAQRLCLADIAHWPDLPAHPVIIDDVSLDCQEQDLLHLFNRFAAEQKTGLLMISEAPLAQMGWQLPDLKSRLRSVCAVSIEAPDDAFLEIMLERHFTQLQCVVPDKTLRYIMARMPRSLHAVKNICSALNALSLAHKKPVSIALARLLFDQQDELPLE